MLALPRSSWLNPYYFLGASSTSIMNLFCQLLVQLHGDQSQSQMCRPEVREARFRVSCLERSLSLSVILEIRLFLTIDLSLFLAQITSLCELAQNWHTLKICLHSAPKICNLLSLRIFARSNETKSNQVINHPHEYTIP